MGGFTVSEMHIQSSKNFLKKADIVDVAYSEPGYSTNYFEGPKKFPCNLSFKINYNILLYLFLTYLYYSFFLL